MLTIGAMALLAVLVMNYYSSAAVSGNLSGQAKSAMMARTIATSYIELASSQIINFDEFKSGGDAEAIVNNPASYLTAADTASLGPDPDDITGFDDFDDFDAWIQDDKDSLGNIYRTEFTVYYVSETNVDAKASTPTLVKRMDIKVYRTFPPVPTDQAYLMDTVRVSYIKSFFRFN